MACVYAKDEDEITMSAPLQGCYVITINFQTFVRDWYLLSYH